MALHSAGRRRWQLRRYTARWAWLRRREAEPTTAGNRPRGRRPRSLTRHLQGGGRAARETAPHKESFS